MSPPPPAPPCPMPPAPTLPPSHICTGTGLAPPTSALGLGSPLPHLHWDWARPSHICTGTGLTPATSSPGLGGRPGRSLGRPPPSILLPACLPALRTALRCATLTSRARRCARNGFPPWLRHWRGRFVPNSSCALMGRCSAREPVRRLGCRDARGSTGDRPSAVLRQLNTNRFAVCCAELGRESPSVSIRPRRLSHRFGATVCFGSASCLIVLDLRCGLAPA
jgi:hypothetical protein